MWTESTIWAVVFLVLSTIHTSYYYYYLAKHSCIHNQTGYHGAMEPTAGIAVSFVRYECLECDTSTTCHDNEIARKAWSDHMVTHARLFRFREWHWQQTVLPMSIDDIT